MTGRATSMQRAAADTPSSTSLKEILEGMNTNILAIGRQIADLNDRLEQSPPEPTPAPAPMMTEDQVKAVLAPTLGAMRKAAASASNLAQSADHSTRKAAWPIGVGFAMPTTAAVLLLAWAAFLR